jgi:formate dehydrogenase subunit gamma
MQVVNGEIAQIIERHRHRPGALLPLLHEVQDRLGHIPDAVVAPIARALNLSRAEVHGIITFYHHFQRTPGGRHTLRLCQAEACQSLGAAALREHAQRTLDCGLHQTTADGVFRLEPVYCLGQCANSPTLAIDDEVYARVTPQRLDELLAAVREQDRS